MHSCLHKHKQLSDEHDPTNQALHTNTVYITVVLYDPVLPTRLERKNRSEDLQEIYVYVQVMSSR